MDMALRRTSTAASTAVVLALTAACTTPQSGEGPEADSAASASTPSAVANAPSDAASAGPYAANEVGALRLRITVGDHRLAGTLRDTAASRELIAQLPLTLDMRDHGGVEKTGRLPQPLSLAGAPAGADPIVGDIGYYAPGNDLVLYYGDQDYYDGIVRLGTLHGDVEAIGRYDDVTVRIERAPS